jgi:hypothetical protein
MKRKRMVHLYEIAVADRDPNQTFRFLVIPQEAMVCGEHDVDAGQAARRLGLSPVREIPTAAALPRAILSLLSGADTESAAESFDRFLGYSPGALSAESRPETAALAEHIAFAEVIPFRESVRMKRSLVSARDICKRPGTSTAVCELDGTPMLALWGSGGLTLGAASSDLQQLLGPRLSHLLGQDDRAVSDAV